MKKILSLVWLFAFTLLCSMNAQNSGLPIFRQFTYTDNSIVWKVSDNGKWAVLSGVTDEQKAEGRAKLVSTSAPMIPIYLQTEADESKNGKCDVADVTDDGNIVVGEYAGVPAYYNRTTNVWTKLPVPTGWTGGGSLVSVTPDGKYAIGNIRKQDDDYSRMGAMWDLTTNSLVTLEGLPNIIKRDDDDKDQTRFDDISADGRYIVMEGAFSYNIQIYVYDRQNKSSFRLGYTKNTDGSYTPINSSMQELDDPVISPNGKYVAAMPWLGDTSEEEHVGTLLYNMETGQYQIFDEQEDHDIVPFAVDNDGNVFGATPGTTTPVRDWSVRVGAFWYPFSLITKQAYGMDFYAKTDYDNTGSPFSVSADGKSVSVMVDPNGGGSYVVEMPENFTTVCQRINLLGNYTVTPTEGAQFTKLSSIEILFDRDIKVKGERNSVSLKDENGTVVRNSIGCTVSSKNSRTLTISFRPTTLESNKQYTVEIPAGCVALASDESKTNDLITINYTGRADEPVAVKTIYPADHSQIAKIDNNSNPIYLTFNAKVAATDTAQAQLIRTEDNTVISSLTVMAQDTAVALYPAATQYLYDGKEYKVVLKAGSVTDLTGNGGNQQLTVNYHGTYVREVSTNKDSLFYDDFSNQSQSLNNWMRYEGDHRTPVKAMEDLGFDADNQPWNFSIRDNDKSTDYCAGSHSMYTPAGKSDDWMVIPQIEITDAYYTLSFDAQSYKKNKKDTLRVMIWSNEENLQEMTKASIDRIKTEGKQVFCEQLSIGLTEEDIEDDWTHYSVDLKDYVGKKVYIAFWNNNDDQSAIFVDNVLVKHNVKYTMALSNEASVVNQTEVGIKGRLTVRSQEDSFKKVELTLCDDNGNAIDTFTQTDLELKNGSKVDFSFNKPLPLIVGETNKFSINVKLDDYADVVKSSVKSLTFKPLRRVVLEEYTGTTCPNCPLGILAIDRMKEQYKGLFIPISIHTYTGDPYASGLSGYSNFLGLNAAPSGIIDRCGTIASPMWRNPGTARYEFSNGSTLWADYVARDFDTPTELELTLGDISIDELNSNFTLPISIRSAINAKNQNINVFMTVVEDSIIASQSSNLYSSTDPALGDWGKNGKYNSGENYNIVHNDIARAVYGTSYNGTPGLFDQTLVAGQTYNNSLTVKLPTNVLALKNCKAIVMLINSDDDKVINAGMAYFDPERAAAGIKTVNSQQPLTVNVSDGYIYVNAGNGTAVNLYTISGMLLGTAKANGTVSLSTQGYHGTAIIKAIGSNGSITKKLIIK